MDHNEIKQKIEKDLVLVLKNIYDPEIPVNIYDLGLVYEHKVSDEFDLFILMTLTSPNCPVAESLPQEVKQQAGKIKNIRSVDLELTFEPPWDKSFISEAALLDLGLL
ncbi:MAG: iron-sulfur cluster assembly protein [Bacteroidales bacterium]|nr:iron-sulfur cluster assembly protein [Bacteroidales bacterium]